VRSACLVETVLTHLSITTTAAGCFDSVTERPPMMVSDSRRDEPVGEDDQQMSSEDPADVRMTARTDEGELMTCAA
jgi:hypothetical protein